jgi:hypothetical protein
LARLPSSDELLLEGATANTLLASLENGRDWTQTDPGPFKVAKNNDCKIAFYFSLIFFSFFV